MDRPTAFDTAPADFETTRRDAGEFIAGRIEALKQFSLEDAPGTNRFPHSEELFRAQEYLIDLAAATGIPHFRDAFNNLYFYLLPDDLSDPSRVVAGGSHLDSVPTGGAYDGVSGCLTALWGLIELKRQVDAGTMTLQHPVVAVLYDNEESAVSGVAYEGSSAAVGKLPPDRLDTVPLAGTESYRGRPMIDHIATFNTRVNARHGTALPTDADAIRGALDGRAGFVDLFLSWGLTAAQIGKLNIAMLETHIEQGDGLNAARAEQPGQAILALIETISSPLRETIRITPEHAPAEVEPSPGQRLFRLSLSGKWDHSGGAAMATRRDTLVAAAALIRLVRSHETPIHLLDLRPPAGSAYAQTKVPGGTEIDLLADPAQFATIGEQFQAWCDQRGIGCAVTASEPPADPVVPLDPHVLQTAAATIRTIAETFTAIDGGTDPERARLRATVSQWTRRPDGGVDLRLDVRNADGDSGPAANRRLRRRLFAEIRAQLPQSEARVSFASGNRILARNVARSAPVRMAPHLVDQSDRHAAALGIRTVRAVSYPGHDAANGAEHGVRDTRVGTIPMESVMVFVPSANGSHNPLEYAAPADLGAAAVVNSKTMESLATA